jgi:hypothetical protein
MSALIGLYLFLSGGALLLAQMLKGVTIQAEPFAAWFIAFQFVLLLAILGGFYAIVRRRLSIRLFWELFFFVLIVFGLWYGCFVFVSDAGTAFFLSLFFTALPAILPRVWIANVFYFFGALGAAMLIAPRLGFDAVMLLFIGFALYDRFVTHEHGPFGTMRGSLFKKSFFPGFLLPVSLKEWMGPVSQLSVLTSYITVAELILIATLFLRFGVVSFGAGLIGLGSSLLVVLLVLAFGWVKHPRLLLIWLGVVGCSNARTHS